MIPRGLVWGCLLSLLVRCGQPIQYTPLDTNGGECALLLGRDRSSLFEYSTNLLRGTLGYGGGQTCITYDAVNQAYIEARKRIHVTVPPVEREWKTEEIAKVGELLLDISAQLTKTYGLSMEEVETGLPQIDTSKTLITEVCPPYLSNVECHAGKYRRLDGLCNNINNPSWGATMTPFTRLVPPQFADGLNAPRQSVLGHSLPLPRIVSRTMHPDEGYHDHAGTVMVVAWGQFMDHDFTLTATPLDARNKNDPEECCDRPPHLKHPYCLEIVVPDDDYFYRGYKVKCMDFVRSFPSVRPNCRLGSKVPYNTLTGVIDGNTVYGVNDAFGRHLRSGYGGELRMNPVFGEYGLKDLLPLKLDIPDEGCTRTNSSQFCFEAGEIRVNEQLVLTCMHTLMAREHNRVARGLSTVNPHWDDETLYQEARRIVIAEIQHITYNEFLPIILGKDVMEKFGLMLQKEGYWDGYDENVNPNIIAAFSAAAFRFGHSLLPTAVERWSKAHKFISSKRLSDLIRRPYDLYRAGVLDEYLMGLMNQVAQAMDDSITQEVTNHLLKKPGNRFGLDLVAFNMQRGREFGVPGYMQYRKFCGLPTADSFEELFGSMPNSTVYRYASIFAHPNDVDLWSGGVSERPLPGSMIGPTFACIIATQLSFARRGDRFWYELPNQPSSFTPEQLQELRKIKLSRIMCDNTDLLDTVQIYPMVLPDHEINPRVPCKAGIIPSIDLTKWAEFPNPAHYNSSKITFPSYGPQEIVVICNGTGACRTDVQPHNNITSDFPENIGGQRYHDGKEISIISSSPVLYIQRLKRWFQSHTKNANRTKRTGRSVPIRSRGNARFISSGFDKDIKAVNNSNTENPTDPKEAISSLTNIQNASVFDQLTFNVENPIFYPQQKKRQRRLNSTFTIQSIPISERNSNKLQHLGVISNIKNKTTFNLEEQKYFPKISRSDREYFDDFNVDYVKTNRGRNHFSIFNNPGFGSSENDDRNTYSDEILLGGTNENHDGTTAFPIVDVDHDYSAEYEYVKQEGQSSGESDENERDVSLENINNYSSEGEKQGGVDDEVNTESAEENEGEEGTEEEGREEEGGGEGGGEEEEEEEEEEEDDTNNEDTPSAVTYEENKGTVQPSFQFAVDSEDIQDRYISKDPLAGPGATKGFNHDFTVIRGVPVPGNVVVQPTRYPTVPSFNTNQIHNIIKTGILPGSVGINGTLTGSGQVAPANPLPGQYLIEPRYPSSYRAFSRRPVSIRTKMNYYLGRGRRPSYSLGSKSQNTFSVNRYPRYRHPIRGGTPLSYHPSGRNFVRIFKHTVTGRVPTFRVNLLEERNSHEGPRSMDIGYESPYGEKEVEQNNMTSIRAEKDSLPRINKTSKYDYSSFYDRTEGTGKSNDNLRRNIPEDKLYNIDSNDDEISLAGNESFYNDTEIFDIKRPLENKRRTDNATKIALHSANTNETIQSIGSKSNQRYNSRNDGIVSQSKVNNLKGKSEHELNEGNNKDEDPRVESKRVGDEYEEELNENSEEFGKRYPVKDMSKKGRNLPLSTVQNVGDNSNSKLKTNFHKPISFSKHWSLEYSYPSYN